MTKILQPRDQAKEFLATKTPEEIQAVMRTPQVSVLAMIAKLTEFLDKVSAHVRLTENPATNDIVDLIALCSNLQDEIAALDFFLGTVDDYIAFLAKPKKTTNRAKRPPSNDISHPVKIRTVFGGKEISLNEAENVLNTGKAKRVAIVVHDQLGSDCPECKLQKEIIEVSPKEKGVLDPTEEETEAP